MKAGMKGICIRVVATLLTAVLVMSLCPVIPSARAAGETYTVTFDLGSTGGTPKFCKGFSDTVTVNAGETALMPFAINEAGNKEYYPLEGWVMENGDGTVILPGAQTEQIRGNVKYIAKWRTDTGYSEEGMTKVNLYANDGMYDNYQFCYYIPQTGYGETSLFAIPINPFKNSNEYVFSEWKKVFIHYAMLNPDETIEGSAATPGNTVTVKGLCERIDLYASCSEKKYSITYHFNDPAGGEDISAGGYVNYSTNYQVTIKGIVEALHNSSKYNDGDRVKGCVFAGWSTTPEGSVDSTYAVGNNVTLTKDLDLYAVWKPASYGYTVKYHFKDKADGEDVKEETVTGTAGLDEAIPYDKSAKTGVNGKTYAFDSVAEEKIITQEPGNNVIDVYYYIDTLSDEKDSQSDSDRIPDIYQKVITYKVNNGTWDGVVLDQITEIVTLRDENGALSQAGTAELKKVPDETKAHGDPDMTHYLWDTPDDARPTTVSYNDSGVYILDFFNADNALIIYPQPVVANYDGEWHTFKDFVVHDYHGNELSDITVTWKSEVKLPDRAGRKDGTPESGDEINLETVLNNAGPGGWRKYFTISGPAGVETKHTILESGTITINPAPVTVELNVDSTDDFTAGIDGKEDDEIVKPSAFKYDEAEKELIVEYVFDGYTHTVELGSEDYNINGLIGGDQKGIAGADVTLSPDGDGGVILAATYVTDTGSETTIDLTKNLKFYRDGEETSSYEVEGADGGGAAGIMTTAIAPLADGEEEVTGSLEDKTINKITVRIVPRPVTYWTFGGTRIFDGYGIPSDGSYNTPQMNTNEQDPEKKDKYHFIAVPKYEEIVEYNGSAIGPEERGFVVRGTTAGGDYTTLNHRPWDDDAGSPVNAGITNCRERITKFQDEHDYTNDYAIDYKLGYFTIYPQSITDDPDEKYHDVKTYISDDATYYDEYVAAYDEFVVEYTYLDREKGTAHTSAELPAFYTGVKLVDGPEASYTAPFKFEGGELRNENNAPEYQKLVEGTDYTVTYQRKNAAGEWVDTDDFSTPGTIQVTYTGIGNYRNRITKEYVLTSASEPGPGTGGGGPSVGTDDHDHYAYIIGKPGGIVDPNGKITRAEIATIIFRLLKEEVREEYWSKTNTFPDVGSRDWYNNAISTLQNLGIVEGRDDGLFHPDDPITRAEMAAMMSRLYDYDMDTGDIHTKFDDVKPDAWYARYVAAAEELGLFYGYPGDPNFYPNKNLTRAEAMTVYNRLLGRKPHRDGLLPESQMVLWPDNMDVNAWYYADVQEATNSHTCDLDGTPVGGERFERWLAPLPVRDWAALEREWSEAYSGYDGHDVN